MVSRISNLRILIFFFLKMNVAIDIYNNKNRYSHQISSKFVDSEFVKLSDEFVTYISGKTRIISNEMQWSLNRVEPIEPNKRIYECRNLSFFMHYLYLGWQNSADWLALCIYRRRTVEWYRAKSAFFVCLIWKVTSTIQSDPKGQLISKCPFGVFKWTKKPTKFL